MLIKWQVGFSNIDFSKLKWYNSCTGENMSRRLTKKSKRRVLLISIVTVTMVTVLLINIFGVLRQLFIKSEEKKFYSAELAKLKEEEAYLKVETEKLQDPDYVARYAREQYLYSKDGELNIRIK